MLNPPLPPRPPSPRRNLLYASYGLLITLVTMVGGLVFVVFLGGFHIYLVITNTTTKALSDADKKQHEIMRCAAPERSSATARCPARPGAEAHQDREVCQRGHSRCAWAGAPRR